MHGKIPRHPLIAILLLLSLPLILLSRVRSEDPPYRSTEDQILKHADELEQARRPEEAVALYEDLIRNGSGRDPRWTAYLFFRQAGAQRQSGDRLGAMESSETAMVLDPSEPNYAAFHGELEGSRAQAERSAVYRPRRNTGSARRLVNSNAILHIFVYGRNTTPWDPEEIDKTRAHVEEADQWIQTNAPGKVPHARPVFVHRYLILTDEPFWRRIDVPDSTASAEYRQAWRREILLRFHADSLAELFDRTFAGGDFDNRCVVFHTSREGATYEMFPSRQLASKDLESTFVPAEKTDWVNLYDAVAYTRSLMYLYGADTLSDKVPDPQAPEADVMNLGAARLEECLVGPLTRYAVGWTDVPPHLTRLRLAAPATRTKNLKGA